MRTRTRSQSSIFHARDAEQFRLGGLFAARRFFNDPPPVASWRDSLPDDLKGEAMFKDIPDVPTLAKVARDAKSALGSRMPIPGPDAGPEALAEFRQKLQKAAPDLIEVPKDPEKRKAVEATIWETLGRPKDEKGYSLEGLDLGGVQFTDEEVGALRKVAQRRGYTVEQFKAFATDAAGERAVAAKAQKDVQAELRAEFGLAYDDRMKEIAVVAEKTGAPQVLRDAIAKGTIDKGTAQYLLSLSKSLGVDTREIAAQRGAGAGALTPPEAERQINEILANPAFLNPGKNPDEHKRLVRRLAELERYASPELAGGGE